MTQKCEVQEKMLTSKFFSRSRPILGLLIVLGFVYLFLNPGIAVSQQNSTSDILVSRAEVLELANKFIQENQDKALFLGSAKVAESKLLY